MIVMSFTSTKAQETGVLIMAHGGGEEWNQLVRDAAEPLAENYTVEFAWGMANYVTLQHAVQRLEEQGVEHIIAVPLFISSHSPIIRQTEFLLGLRETMADTPMPLMHHSQKYVEMTGAEVDSGNYKGHMLMPPNLQPIERKADITLTHALDDHSVMAEILRNRILALSKTPEAETVILVAHGPNRESDNVEWIHNLESLARKIQSRQKEEGKAFKQIYSLTVRDDANESIHEQAKQQFRALVRQANDFGNVIVIPVFLSSGGREKAVAERLAGLEFSWSGQTVLPDNKITEFLMRSVQDAVLISAAK